jgi:gliding motility-associated lipoprotein GldH
MKGKYFSKKISFLFAACCIILLACNHLDLFEKNTPIPGYEWKSDFAVNGSFSIADTTAAYILFIVLRHTDSYKYNNIWLNVGIQNPGDTMFYQKLDLQLGYDAGGWEGSGMNDIWEIRKPLNATPLRFIKPGNFNYSIRQIMRDNPLLHVMSIGLRVEKSS